MSKKFVSDAALERAVLCIIAEHGKEATIDTDTILSEDVFSDDTNRTMYRCLTTALKGCDNVDFPTFYATANSLGYNDFLAKNSEYIDEIFKAKTSRDNARQHALRLKRIYTARKLQQAAIDSFNILSKIDGHATSDSIIAACEEPIFKAASVIDDGECVSSLIHSDIDEYMAYLQSNPVEMIGIPSPFSTWNLSVGGGFRNGTVSLIGARPKSGKTTCSINVARHVAQLGIPVLMLDTEMSRYDLLHKLVSNISKVPFTDIETGKFAVNAAKQAAVLNAANIAKALPIHYRNIAGKAFGDVISIIRRWLVKEIGTKNGTTEPCLIIYDYFKLQEREVLSDMQEYQALGYQISDMTNFAIQYQVPVLAFVQLNREGDVKETATAISQSDRLLWLCSSFSMLKRKTREEMQNDIATNNDRSNGKLIPLECRFGPGMKDGDYIKIHTQFDYALMNEYSGNTFEVEDASGAVSI